MPELSIIIVNYKNQDLIIDCVRSIVEKENELDYEIIVIDNNSEDESEKELRSIYPDLQWIQMGYNSGFGRANNVGLGAASGQYVLLLNSDILVKENNSIFQCLQFLKSRPNSERIILGTRLVNQDGSYQETLRLKFPGVKREIRANALYILLFDRILKKHKNLSDKKKQKAAHYTSGEVKWINGAFLMMNYTTVVKEELFFDTDFFLYGEDMEWSWRASQQGMKFYHWNQQEFTHIGSASSNNEKQRYQQITASDWLYLRKTRGFFYTFFTMTIVWNNQILDGILHFFAKVRGKKFTDSQLRQKEYRKWTFETLRRYYFLILFAQTYSYEETFKVNCYEDY